jgi:transcriptional regulator of nitric oxide reductase
VSGFAAGLFFPLGEKILGEKQGGALLEALDCSGGAIGAILAGILLVPLFGPLKAVLIGLPLILVWSIRQWTPSRVSRRTLGTIIFIVGLALWLLLTVPTNAAGVKLSPSQIKSLELAGLKTKSEIVKGKSVLKLSSPNGITQGWIFRSRDFLKEHPDGYEGPIYLLIKISPDGTIKNFIITSHHEDSRYLKRALRCKSKLIGTTVSTKGKLPEIDAVTGATFSSQAIIETVLQATRNFIIAANIKSQQPATKATAKKQTVVISDESDAPPPATVRKIDEKKYKQLIKQGKLSNHKALFQSPQNK